MQEKKLIEQPHSTKIAISSKGLWSGEVKCYGISIEEAWDRAIKYAGCLEEIIKEKNKVI